MQSLLIIDKVIIHTYGTFLGIICSKFSCYLNERNFSPFVLFVFFLSVLMKIVARTYQVIMTLWYCYIPSVRCLLLSSSCFQSRVWHAHWGCHSPQEGGKKNYFWFYLRTNFWGSKRFLFFESERAGRFKVTYESWEPTQSRLQGAQIFTTS